ncbi:MAG: 23S rRNA (adenine(2030)-N(6))-methyltransferase RlmJ, partial [Pseudomonadota bacterium]
VLKHVVLVQMLAYLTAKDTPLWVVDTHAGAGAYSLSSSFARKKGEFKDGIGRLWGRSDLPLGLAEYVHQIKAFNPDGALHAYPGSPQIALQMTRPQDRLRLFELHTTDVRILQDHFRRAGRRVSVREADGFEGLKSLLPPPSRRALVLIDPSYEDKADYARVLATLRDALQRFATGTYAVWYPQVQRRESQELPGQLQQLAGKDWLHASLKVMAPARDGLGLHGSGMFVFNPPWKLEAALRPVMPILAKLLGQDGKASFCLQSRQT